MSAIKIRIPTQLRTLTGGAAEVAVDADTVGGALKALDGQHAGFGDRLFDEQGKLRRFVNVFVAEEDIRFLEGQATAVKDGDLIDIVPAIAGG